jgi:acetyl/propionyl-CoA carboxylase alpha subunit
MARHVKYLSLGTFEFLANPERDEFYFLEVNPRLQVEHTVTESIANVDLVKIQLEIAQGARLEETRLQAVSSDVTRTLKLHAVQLRLTAEDVQRDWTLSIGRVEAFSFPTGHGVRVDTHLHHRHTTVVGSDYDSLLAKIIVTGESEQAVRSKCRRALQDTWLVGVKTNIDVLRAIIAHEDFERQRCDTSWLERQMGSLLSSRQDISRGIAKQHETTSSSSLLDETAAANSLATSSSTSSSSLLLRKGDAWALKLTSPAATEETHHIKLTRVIRNEFPSALRAEIEYSHPQSDKPQTYTIEATSSSASSASIMAAGKHRRGDANNPLHIIVPFPGKLVEVAVDEGDEVRPGQVVCVVQQMKMELEVRASRGGRVKWVTEAQDGEDIAEGTLAAELEDIAKEDKTRALL